MLPRIVAALVLCWGVLVMPLHAQVPANPIVPNDNPLSSVLKGGLVPCGNEIKTFEKGNMICYTGECSICDAQTMAGNILTMLILAAVLLLGFLFIYAAGLLLFSPLKPSNISKAWRVIRRGFIGLFLVLIAWLAIDFVMQRFFFGSELSKKYTSPWNEFLCSQDADVRCVEKITPIPLNLADTPLDPYQKGLDCESQLGGECRVSCNKMLGGVTGVYRKDAKGCGMSQICCLPIGTGDICTGASGKHGTCQDWNFCPDTGEISAHCKGEQSVCCPGVGLRGRSEYDKNKISSQRAVGQLRAAGIKMWSGFKHGSGVEQGVIDDIIALYKAAGSPPDFLVNTLTGNHPSTSHHVNGTKSDLHVSPALVKYIETNWVEMAPRGRRSDGKWNTYGGPQYYSPDFGMVCVNEVRVNGKGGNHFDCCHNQGQTTCR
jgi:hypothetical protein